MQARRRRGVLSFFLGIIIGILLVVGGVVIALYSIKLSTIEGWVGSEIVKGEDPESLKDKNVIDLVTWATGYVSNTDNLTINKFNATFGEYIPLEIAGVDLSSIADIPVTSLGDNVDLLMNLITVGTVESFGVDLSVIPLLARQDKATPVVEMFDIVMDSVTGDAATLSGISNDFGLPLPDHAVLQKIADIPINQLSTELDDTILGLTPIEILGDGQTGIFSAQALGNTQIRDISTAVTTLQLQYIMNIDESNALLYALRGSTVETISDDVMNLTLGTFIDVSEASPLILRSLQNTTISGLPDKIDSLTLNEVVETNETSGILYTLTTMEKPDGTNYKITELDSAVTRLIDDSSVRDLMGYAGQPLADETLDDPTTPENDDLYELSLNEFIGRIQGIIDYINNIPVFPSV